MKVMTSILEREHNYKKIMGFDIETEGKNNEFVLATFYSDDLSFTAYSKEDVKKFISQHKLRNYNVFSTNLGFDFLGTLYKDSDRWSVCERNGTIYSFKWYRRLVDGELKDPINFFDTLRLLPFSVEKLGKLVNIPKMKHPKCFATRPTNDKDWEELKTYCMNDSRVSYEFIKQIIIPFLKKYNLKFKSTIGSMALADFRTNHLKIPMFQEPEKNRIIAFKGYYGGRTETFRRGLFKNVYCFDINSLYPSAMLNKIPNPNKFRLDDKGSLYTINHREGVSEVLVYVPDTLNMPPLPYHKDGKLIFPTGTFRGYYNHVELVNAMKYGVKIVEVYEQLSYKDSDYFFKSFIEEHYAERLKLQAEKNPLEIMEKNVMNNLYGKFAFNYRKSSSLIPAHDLDFNKHIVNATYLEPMLNNKFMSVEANSISAPIYSFPIISSYITSYARITMYNYLSDMRIQNKIISMDTDSIFMDNYEGEIETSHKLGDMKLEDGYPIKDAIFIRPKMYKTFKPKCKGFKFNYVSKIGDPTADEQFKKMLKGEELKQERFIKFRSAIRSKVHHKNGILLPNQIIEITKNLDLEDTKRVWEGIFSETENENSKPIKINYETELKIAEEKELLKSLRANDWNEKTNKKIKLDFINSDKFDKFAVGSDISYTEFLENIKEDVLLNDA